MNAFAYSIVLVITSQVAYHLAVKAMPAQTHPLALLVVVYGLAIITCLVLAPFTGAAIAASDLRRLASWQAGLLALSVVGIEVGYLLAYRSGWTLGVTFAVAGSATVATLALIGFGWFGEHLTAQRLVGLALALAGGWLVVA